MFEYCHFVDIMMVQKDKFLLTQFSETERHACLLRVSER